MYSSRATVVKEIRKFNLYLSREYSFASLIRFSTVQPNVKRFGWGGAWWGELGRKMRYAIMMSRKRACPLIAWSVYVRSHVVLLSAAAEKMQPRNSFKAWNLQRVGLPPCTGNDGIPFVGSIVFFFSLFSCTIKKRTNLTLLPTGILNLF